MPTFVHKLQEILEDENNRELVSWDCEGRSFSIHNMRHFENLILPKYFRHARFSSFVRQLNMYNFHKVKTAAGSSCSFGNESFTRGSSKNMDIERKVYRGSNAKRCSISTVASLTNLEPMVSEEMLSLSALELSNTSEIEDVEPTSELIARLVEEVRLGEYLLASDVRDKVESLLTGEIYNGISRRLLPFIMECLGVEDDKARNQ